MQQINQQLQVIAQNQELAKPESTPLKNGESELLSAAIEGTKISLLKDPPFDLTKNVEDQKPDIEIRQALRYAMLKIGLRASNLPTEEEKIVLIDHIKKNYGGHTLAEIRLAFDMAILDKLDIDDISCYENFSCAYFSKIMNAYRRWSKQEYTHISKPLQPVTEKIESTSDETMLDWFRSVRKEVQSETLAVAFMSIQVYDWLDSKGYISVDAKTKREYIDKAIEFRISQLMHNVSQDPSMSNRKEYTNFKKMLEAGELEGVEVKVIKDSAKKILLFDLVKNGILDHV